jgi:hypothetical protein
LSFPASSAEAVAGMRQQEAEKKAKVLLAKIQGLSEEELERELLRLESLVGEEEPARG